MTQENKTFTVKLNKKAHTATIRVYYNGKFFCKYRTCKMSKDEFENLNTSHITTLPIS